MAKIKISEVNQITNSIEQRRIDKETLKTNKRFIAFLNDSESRDKNFDKQVFKGSIVVNNCPVNIELTLDALNAALKITESNLNKRINEIEKVIDFEEDF